MNILFLLRSCSFVNSSGGAERVACQMSGEMVRRGHDVTILCDEMQAGLPFYTIDPRVRIINMNGSGRKTRLTFTQKFKREVVRCFRKFSMENIFRDTVLSSKSIEIHRLADEIAPDIIVSFFLDDLHDLCYAIPVVLPVVLMQHEAPQTTLRGAPAWKRRLLDCCDAIQVLLPGHAKYVSKICSTPVFTIPNIVEQIDSSKSVDHAGHRSSRRILCIGRYESQKNQRLLVEAFALLESRHPDWSLHFYGQINAPKYYRRLENFVSNNRLHERIFLHGVTKDPLGELRESDIFAFPSLHEGFGLVLGEAMSVGLPCVGLRSSPGVNEMIVDGENGFLCDATPGDFATKIERLIDNADLRAEMGKQGINFVRQFASERIWDQWERLLIAMVDNRGRSRIKAA